MHRPQLLPPISALKLLYGLKIVDNILAKAAFESCVDPNWHLDDSMLTRFDLTVPR